MQVAGPGDHEGAQRPYFGTVEENKGLKVTPVNAAAMDPAALPGLVSSPPDAKEEDEAPATDEKKEPATDAEDAGEPADAADASGDDDGDTGGAGAQDETGAADADGNGDGDADEDEATAAGDSGDDGPVFEAADRRGSVTVNSTGVRFQLDDTEAEFTWPEIGAVEYKTSRFGRRLVLSVHDSRGVCPAEVEAPDKATLKEWASGLESALDAYFEDTAP